jgi:serine/threonine protein kinase
MVLGRAGVQF